MALSESAFVVPPAVARPTQESSATTSRGRRNRPRPTVIDSCPARCRASRGSSSTCICIFSTRIYRFVFVCCKPYRADVPTSASDCWTSSILAKDPPDTSKACLLVHAQVQWAVLLLLVAEAAAHVSQLRRRDAGVQQHAFVAACAPIALGCRL